MSTQIKVQAPAPEKFGVKSEVAAQIKAQFQPMLAEMDTLENERNAIIETANKEVTPDVVRQAKSLLSKYVKVRTGTAAIHKEQKAYFLSMGRFVDGWKNAQIAASTGAEESLAAIVNHFETIEAERIEALRVSRWEKLKAYKDEEPAGLADMEDDVFAAYLEISKRNHIERLEAEQRAQEERERQELADKREREILHLRRFWPDELPSLGEITADQYAELVKGCQAREKAYIAEQEKIARERAEIEKKAALEREAAAKREAKLKAEQDAIKKQAEADRKRIEAEREAERQAAENKRMAAIKEAQAAERKRIEAERAELERIAEEKRQEAEAKRVARSDTDKLLEMAATRPEIPNLESADAVWIADEYAKLLHRAEKWVAEQIEKKLS